MLQIRKVWLRVLCPFTNGIRIQSTKSVDPKDLSWSTGEKQMPLSKDITEWYKNNSSDLMRKYSDPKLNEHNYPYKRADGGIQYYNFVYYPRHENEVDPPITPSPLLMVIRRKKATGRPYWEQHIMEKLGLTKKRYKSYISNVVILKNIPEINALLWQVKHLVEIKPIKLPDNIPDDPNPLHYFLTEEGEIKYLLEPKYTEKDLTVDPEIQKKKMSYDWVDNQMRKIYHNSLVLEF